MKMHRGTSRSKLSSMCTFSVAASKVGAFSRAKTRVPLSSTVLCHECWCSLTFEMHSHARGVSFPCFFSWECPYKTPPRAQPLCFAEHSSKNSDPKKTGYTKWPKIAGQEKGQSQWVSLFLSRGFGLFYVPIFFAVDTRRGGNLEVRGRCRGEAGGYSLGSYLVPRQVGNTIGSGMVLSNFHSF
jgi:hypothetical protein